MKKYDDGIKLYEIFHDNTWEEIYELDFLWPTPARKLGKALAIAYRSDKWHPGTFTDYIHRHDKPYPTVWVQGNYSDENKELPFPKKPFAILGYALDMEYKNIDGEVLSVSWLEKDKGKKTPTKKLPLLAALSNGLLVIIPQDKNPAMVFKGKGITVTSHGIEG
jgi:hypothetical protein